MTKVLILCTGNSCRSQMADGLLSNLYKDLEVFSAGTKPEKVNPFAIRAMKEIGIDISSNISDNINKYSHISFDYKITLCDIAKEVCPSYPKAKKNIHRSFRDPANAKGNYNEKLLVYIEVRNQLSTFLKELFPSHFI